MFHQLLVLLCFFLGLSYSDATQNAVDCKVQYGFGDDFFHQLDMEVLRRNDNFKDFLVCVGNKENLLKGNGMAEREIARMFMQNNMGGIGLGPDFNMEPMIEKCMIQKDSPRETAFEIFKCTFETVRGPGGNRG